MQTRWCGLSLTAIRPNPSHEPLPGRRPAPQCASSRRLAPSGGRSGCRAVAAIEEPCISGWEAATGQRGPNDHRDFGYAAPRAVRSIPQDELGFSSFAWAAPTGPSVTSGGAEREPPRAVTSPPRRGRSRRAWNLDSRSTVEREQARPSDRLFRNRYPMTRTATAEDSRGVSASRRKAMPSSSAYSTPSAGFSLNSS